MLSNHNAIETAGSSSYQIPNSLRVRASASAYLSRSFAGAPSTWTFAAWVKRGALGTDQLIACARYSGGTVAYIDVNASDQIVIALNGVAVYTSTAVFRDPSAWLHIVVRVTQSGLSYLYVNGAQIGSWTSGATSWLFTNAANYVNAIGRYGDTSASYFDGYLSHVHFIDGQALDPTYFGQFNSDGVWTPKAYTGTYGTNGFKLDFSNGSSLTTLGNDSSGNGNNWTLNNFSLTAGATYDWMVDTPTNNYAVLNPIDPVLNGLRYGEFLNANLSWRAQYNSNPAQVGVVGVPWPTSGKWYCEVTIDSTSNDGTWGYLGVDGEYEVSWYERKVNNSAELVGSAGTVYPSAFGAGSVVQLACDGATGKIWYGLNGTWVTVSGTPDPVAGSGHAHVLNSTRRIGFRGRYGTAYNAASINFGQRPFAYTPPTGFKALCTTNLGTGSITTSGSFTGNALADGPCIWLNGDPVALTINGNAVTWGTHADKLAGGFKLRTASTSYNLSGTNTYTVTTTGKLFGDQLHVPNTAKGNP